MYAIVLNPEFGMTRDELAAWLRADGIDSRTFFCPMNQQPCLTARPGARLVPCPVADRLWETGLYLPSTCHAAGPNDRNDCRQRAARVGARQNAGTGAMSAFGGRYAELYDLFYSAKPYGDEAAFVQRCLREHGVDPAARVLELACGTGSYALALERHGYQVVATDQSEDMLARARLKALAAGSAVEFRHQDMRTMALDGPPFDAVICLFDSIGFVLSNEGLLQVLGGVHRHLKPGGLLLFDFWHAAAMLRHYEPVRVARWRTAGGEVVRVSETTLDCVSQVGTVVQTVYLELSDDGRCHQFTETLQNRCFLVQEMAGWLSHANFVPLRWMGGFAANAPVTGDTWHVLAAATRR